VGEPSARLLSTGVKQKVLWRDEGTGAMVALIRYPVGTLTKAHSHPEANQLQFGLEGEMEIQGNRFPVKGLFQITPKGVKHGGAGEKFTKDVVLLTYWDGPPAPEF